MHSLVSSRLKSSSFLLTLILLTFALLHLPGITHPPLDEHSWRQSDTAAVARNFAEESPNILYPRIDMRNQYSGITGMEFPLYNYGIFGIDTIFGYQNWHGRIISLIMSLVGLAAFAKFIELRYTRRISLAATFTLALMPLWFYFSRNIQPDVSMVSLALVSLYCAQRYKKTHSRGLIYLAFGALTLACLVKIPALFVVPPLLVVFGASVFDVKNFLTWRLAGFTLVMGFLLAGWYWHSAQISAHYGLGQYYYGDLDLHKSLALLKHGEFYRILAFYILPLKASTFIIVGCLGLGALWSAIRRDLLPLVWLASIAIFLIIFANKSFYHNYYSLPIIPPIALLTALGLRWLYQIFRRENKTLALGLVGAFSLSLIWVSYHRTLPLYTLHTPEFATLESQADKVSSRGDSVITNYGGNPLMLFFSHRKGWSLLDTQLTPSIIAHLHQLGAHYIIRYVPGLSEPNASTVIEGASVVSSSPNIIIYKIQ